MQSALIFMVQHGRGMTGEFWPDLFTTIGIIIPHLVTVILAFLGYLKSRDNGKKVSRIERTLNGKVETSTKAKK